MPPELFTMIRLFFNFIIMYLCNDVLLWSQQIQVRVAFAAEVHQYQRTLAFCKFFNVIPCCMCCRMLKVSSVDRKAARRQLHLDMGDSGASGSMTQELLGLCSGQFAQGIFHLPRQLKRNEP